MQHELEQLNACTKDNTPKFTFAGQVLAAKCVYVYDGDTAHFAFRPCPNAGFRKISCRMLGYNSAEMKGKGVGEAEKAAAHAAKAHLQELIENRICELHLGEFDKYGRPLADVYVADGAGARIHVNGNMIAAGFGQPYDGRGEKKW